MVALFRPLTRNGTNYDVFISSLISFGLSKPVLVSASKIKTCDVMFMFIHTFFSFFLYLFWCIFYVCLLKLILSSTHILSISSLDGHTSSVVRFVVLVRRQYSQDEGRGRHHRERGLGREAGLYSHLYWIRCWAGEYLEISLSLLQEWWR